jgi:hypothetical protein
MYSLSIDYLFNRIYDVLLWIKYVWLFVLLRKSPDDYLIEHADRTFDGLRDRGWFDIYLAQKDAVVPTAEAHVSLWQKMLQSFGINLPDSDNDGIPDVSDPKPYDTQNLTASQLKERYEEDYTLGDNFRDIFGIGPKDSDKDGVPDSYEKAHNLDPKNPDTDRDGLPDGEELARGTDPLNNDTDSDLVLDGRDAHPLDQVRSLAAGDADSDGDGIGDTYEADLHTDVANRDSDADGIPDGMDSYPLDAENISQAPILDVGQATEGLYLSVQNPALSFFTDLLSVAAIAIILVFAYALLRWLFTFLEGLHHYEHHFEHGGDHGRRDMHVVKDEDRGMPAGIPGLPVHEDAPAVPPTQEDFEEHPRFAIIQGYMSSPSEALWRIGILEADNMLAEVLREKGYAGETVADMLKEASFKTVQMAWDAHAVRNRIAHEGSDFQLTEREAKRAFTLYESVFRELKAIK